MTFAPSAEGHESVSVPHRRTLFYACSMTRKHPLEVQGHRGARGLRPENTLPSFEAALDAGANSLETDVHLTADGIPVLIHDPPLGPCFAPTAERRWVHRLTAAQLRDHAADRNPDPRRFPD